MRISAAACGVLLLAAVPAWAAAPAAEPQSVATDPDANATVDAPLEMIHVLFHNPVDMTTGHIVVTDKNGKPVDVGPAMPMGTDHKLLMAIPKTPLPAGTYHVEWQIKGTDGKPLSGAFTFTAK